MVKHGHRFNSEVKHLTPNQEIVGLDFFLSDFFFVPSCVLIPTIYGAEICGSSKNVSYRRALLKKIPSILSIFVCVSKARRLHVF